VSAATARTALFVPGDRSDRFGSATAAGAGLVIVDWEDAVAPAARERARAATVEAILGGLIAAVRVSAPGMADHPRDLAALDRLAGRDGLAAIVIAKAEDPAGLGELARRFPSTPLVPLVESAAGVLAAGAIARSPGVVRLAFGGLDFALDLGAEVGGPATGHAMIALALESRAAGIAAPFASPSPEVRELEVVESAARAARAAGFGGGLCIHPRQVPIVEAAFLPTEAELDWARRVVDVGEGVGQVDGAMVDRPLVERARRILAISDITEAPSSDHDSR